MDHTDHVNLLRRGVEAPGGRWADVGAGVGAFTLALADLLGPGAEIYVIDRAPDALRANARALSLRFPATSSTFVVGDFTRELELPALDGIVMANALHFVAEQGSVLSHLRRYLQPRGRLLVVEYNLARANRAVPFPVPPVALERLAAGAGFTSTAVLARRPSRTFAEMYSAACW